MRYAGWKWVFCAGILFSSILSVCSYGQAVNATLLGTVTDSSGGVIGHAKVTITEVDTGISRSGSQ